MCLEYHFNKLKPGFYAKKCPGIKVICNILIGRIFLLIICPSQSLLFFFFLFCLFCIATDFISNHLKVNIQSCKIYAAKVTRQNIKTAVRYNHKLCCKQSYESYINCIKHFYIRVGTVAVTQFMTLVRDII